jgi:uncharacterized lipoprotein YehR (DUF1307 family)
MKLLGKILMIMFAVSLTFGLVACEKEGSGEKAGKALDQTMDDAKEKLDDVSK